MRIRIRIKLIRGNDGWYWTAYTTDQRTKTDLFIACADHGFTSKSKAQAEAVSIFKPPPRAKSGFVPCHDNKRCSTQTFYSAAAAWAWMLESIGGSVTIEECKKDGYSVRRVELS